MAARTVCPDRPAESTRTEPERFNSSSSSSSSSSISSSSRCRSARVRRRNSRPRRGSLEKRRVPVSACLHFIVNHPLLRALTVHQMGIHPKRWQASPDGDFQQRASTVVSTAFYCVGDVGVLTDFFTPPLEERPIECDWWRVCGFCFHPCRRSIDRGSATPSSSAPFRPVRLRGGSSFSVGALSLVMADVPRDDFDLHQTWADVVRFFFR